MDAVSAYCQWSFYLHYCCGCGCGCVSCCCCSHCKWCCCFWFSKNFPFTWYFGSLFFFLRIHFHILFWLIWLRCALLGISLIFFPFPAILCFIITLVLHRAQNIHKYLWGSKQRASSDLFTTLGNRSKRLMRFETSQDPNPYQSQMQSGKVHINQSTEKTIKNALVNTKFLGSKIPKNAISFTCWKAPSKLEMSQMCNDGENSQWVEQCRWVACSMFILIENNFCSSSEVY